MSGIVWLASYPKSGNTWFRIMAANVGQIDAPVDINNLPVGNGIASGRGAFETLTLLDSGLLTHDEADVLRPSVYEALAHHVFDEDDKDKPEGDADGPRLVKAHDAYLTTPLGEPLMGGARAATGAILIVRDPRDVAPSLANHRHISIDEAIEFMNRPSAFSGGVNGQANQLRQRLLDWSGHAASWLDQTDIPVRLVRYEDMKARPVEVFRAAMEFAARPVTLAEAEKAVEFSSFDRLQAQERAEGFREWPGAEERPLFFRRGQSEAWRTELTADQVARLEAAHAPMMRRLGYRLETCEDDAAREAAQA